MLGIKPVFSATDIISCTETKKPRYPIQKSFESCLQEALYRKSVKICDIEDKKYSTLSEEEWNKV